MKFPQLFFLMFLVSWECLIADTLRIGFFHLPPHCYTQDGEAKGSAVEYFRLVAEEMKVTPVFREYPLTRLLISLERGESDAVLFMAKTPERTARFVFPQEPYASVRSGLVVARTSPWTKVANSDALKNLKIGTTQDGFLTPMMTVPGLQLVPLANQNAVELNLKKLLAGRLDGVYQPDTAIFYYLSDYMGVEKEIRILDLPEPPTAIYMVFSRMSAIWYRKTYESALEKVKSQRIYSSLLQTYLNNP